MTKTMPHTASLSMQTPIISASILGADLAHLARDCRAAIDAGANALHIDVMDHHYVPNLTFGADVCKALTNAKLDCFIDVHLMVDTPENYIKPFADAGAHLITFHPSTAKDPNKLIDDITGYGMQAGLAFNPDEKVSISNTILKKLDLILVMSVFPGFCGQSFMPEVLNKFQPLIEQCNAIDKPLHLAIDGGINLTTINKAYQAGANYFVIGSGLFGADNICARIKQLHQACM